MTREALHGEGITQDFAYDYTVKFSEGGTFCAGVLITRQDILTIEHCVNDSPWWDPEIILQAFDELGESVAVFHTGVESINHPPEAMHPEETDDIVIVHLDDPVDPEYYRPVLIDDLMDPAPIAGGSTVTAVAYKEESGGVPDETYAFRGSCETVPVVDGGVDVTTPACRFRRFWIDA